MKQGFKPKLINDIEVGMKVLFSLFGKRRGTVKYVGPVAGHGSKDWLGVELDPDQGWLNFFFLCRAIVTGLFTGCNIHIDVKR